MLDAYVWGKAGRLAAFRPGKLLALKNRQVQLGDEVILEGNGAPGRGRVGAGDGGFGKRLQSHRRHQVYARARLRTS